MNVFQKNKHDDESFFSFLTNIKMIFQKTNKFVVYMMKFFVVGCLLFLLEIKKERGERNYPNDEKREEKEK